MIRVEADKHHEVKRIWDKVKRTWDEAVLWETCVDKACLLVSCLDEGHGSISGYTEEKFMEGVQVTDEKALQGRTRVRNSDQTCE